MARPRKQIDIEKVELLARAGCSDHTIAHALGIGENTIKRRFGPRVKEWRESAISDAKLKLWNRALDDNRKDSTTSLIFWLKNYGGMRDNLALSNPDGSPLDVRVSFVEAVTSKD